MQYVVLRVDWCQNKERHKVVFVSTGSFCGEAISHTQHGVGRVDGVSASTSFRLSRFDEQVDHHFVTALLKEEDSLSSEEFRQS